MAKLHIYILLLVVGVSSITAQSVDPYRLSSIFSPTYYQVHITITNDSFTNTSNAFTGVSVVYFTVTNSTNSIQLHSSAAYILVQSVTLNNVDIPSGNVISDSATDILTIIPGSELIPGTTYALTFNYIGQLSVTDMYGFYKSSYEDAEGNTKYLATTQFQATHARRAFPSWDEPSFKARFQLFFTYPSDLNVLSNTPQQVLTTDTDTGLSTIQFEQTPVMSTYLVAFIISEFTCTEGESIDNVPYQICSREESSDDRDWALEIGPPILASLNTYTGINYRASMAKLDQVAIPDFAAGAMENWGLVTYRETGLLWDPLESSNSFKQSIAAVIAHEFTHFWFGNLVTCYWWSVTFLNEGFARLFQYQVFEEVLPDWQMTNQLVVAVIQTILETDSYLTSQSLQSTVSTAAEVSGKFTSITYNKGAGILRMVELTLGAEKFRDGLRQYLTDYSYQAVEPDDLWNSLDPFADSESLPTNLSAIMANWVQNSGYPLLTVTRSGRNVFINQERFLLSGTDRTSSWYVPVSYTTSDNISKFQVTTPDGWLTPNAGITVTLPENAEWIILNNQHAGYFRVNYDISTWNSIAAALASTDFSGIPDLNRAQIVSDAFNLAKVSKLLYSRVFSIIDFLREDISYFPWYPALTEFGNLLRRVGQESPLGQAISTHILSLIGKYYQSVPITTLNETDHLYTLRQVSANTWACNLGHEDCISATTSLFSQYRQTSARPNKNLRSIVYCNGLRHSNDSSDWDFLWNAYLTADLATERSVIITALGCTRDKTILNDYLLKSITLNSGIRSQDASSVFAAVYSGNPEGIDVAFEFLITYYEAINNYYQSMNAFANLMSGVVNRFTTQEQVDRLKDVIATGELGEAFEIAATEALETAEANLEWIAQFNSELHAYYGLYDDDIDPEESTQPEYRLPRLFQPFHYEVLLRTTAEAFTATGNTFEGTAIIHFYVSRISENIQLHANSANININSIQLNNVDIPLSNAVINATTTILTINLESPLAVGTLYILNINYIGTFGTSLSGFYKSSYVDDDGSIKYLLTTQFQTVSARRAFPCFDEPSFKATFQILITYPSGLNAKSNTPGTIVQTDAENNLTTVQFDKTPIMSTYLIAFVVSDYTCTAGDSIGSTPYQVCSRDNAKDTREWAVEIGPKVLNSLNVYTGFDYSNSIAKMDQFAIPDFSAGAMENWGLVTYREEYLLWDPLVSTNLFKHYVATIIAHEFAHMWFGNLVTCSWWSETFLNEGFATYFEFFAVHDVLPEWELDKHFVVRVHQSVLTTDSYLTSQPLQSSASTPAQISSKFGTITYYKGGSIFRMVEHILGSNTFRTGIQHYLDVNQYKSAKPEDLWEALSTVVDNTTSRLPASLDVVMENWIKRSGYPLLDVVINGNNIVVSQTRFLLSGEDTTSKWYVPISYTTANSGGSFDNTAPVAWLTPDINSITLTGLASSDWIILNNHQTAFYRINYDETLWERLGAALRGTNFAGIPEENRAQVVDDLFTFISVDKMSYTRAFRILDFLEQDSSYFPWYRINTELNTLFGRIALHSHLGVAMTAHLLRLSAELYESAPIENINEDNQLYTLKQILAVTLACRLGNADCAEGVRQHFSSYKNDGVEPPKNLRSIILCNGIRHSTDESDWEFLWNIYANTNSSSARSVFITALGCTNDESILTQYLTRSIASYTGPLAGDTAAIFASVYDNHIGVDVAYNFFIQNQFLLYEHYINWNTVGTLLRGIANRFTTHNQLERLQNAFNNGQIHESLTSSATAAISTVQSNLVWIEKYQDDLYEYYGLEPTTTSTATTPTTSPTTTPIETTTEDSGTMISVSVVLILTLTVLSQL